MRSYATRALRSVLETSSAGYRLYLQLAHGAKSRPGLPHAPWHNAVLKNRLEAQEAVEQARSIGLYPHPYGPKTWDSLAALDLILANTRPRSRILDAGSATYSVFLPWLFLYGYTDLLGVNLEFKKTRYKGPIRYEPGDLTDLAYPDGHFDAIVCLSVIEHGVKLDKYFRETSRLLKPGGLLITSTDYWEDQLDVGDRQAYGRPVRVFGAKDIRSILEQSHDFGFEETGEIDLQSQEKVVHWKKIALDYTFVVFALRKSNRRARARDSLQAMTSIQSSQE